MPRFKVKLEASDVSWDGDGEGLSDLILRKLEPGLFLGNYTLDVEEIQNEIGRV